MEELAFLPRSRRETVASDHSTATTFEMKFQRLTDSAMETERGPSAALVILFAIATGALVANLYYAQPLIASIGPELKISPDVAGSIVSITQIGYGIGLFFLVSLADLV